MTLKHFFKFSGSFFALISAVALTACGDDSSSAASGEDSSSSVASFKSSSSLSTRADIDYKDTIPLKDTLKIYLEFFKGDSSKMDESELYIDSAATSVPLYLGDFPKGSRINVYASTSDIENDRIRIKSEFGEYLQTLKAVPKNKDSKDSIYSNYMVPSYGSESTAAFKDFNQFVTFSDNHYYLELSGEFNDNSNLRLKVTVDTSYYQFTGENDSAAMKMSDTLRGIFLIEKAPEEISIGFSASEGYSVNLTTEGENILLYKLTDGDTELGRSKTNLDTMLVPNDTVNWSIKITPETFASIWTAPFVSFEAITKARRLEQGEYFSNPDSIDYPGEAFVRTRPKDDRGIYKYNLRQEQFVWIGDYSKGDSILLQHWIKNYSDENFNSLVTYEILDKNKKVQGSISSTYGGGFSVRGDMPEGPYYLHYLRLKSYPLDQGLEHDSLRYRLQLYTMVQQPGLLKTLKFLDPEKDETYKQKDVFVGDSIRFSDFKFLMEPNDKTHWKVIGSDISWWVPCESLDYINSNYKKEDCLADPSNGKEQEISSYYLIAQDAANETAKLIAQSVADPSKRDTLSIFILAK